MALVVPLLPWRHCCCHKPVERHRTKKCSRCPRLSQQLEPGWLEDKGLAWRLNVKLKVNVQVRARGKGKCKGIGKGGTGKG